MFKFLTLFLFVWPLFGFSQELRRCGYLEAREYLLQIDAAAKVRFEAAENTWVSEEGVINKSQTQAIFTIPVVFHILHQGGPENISDAQIQDALSILNRDFNKLNPDTVNIVGAFQNLASDCQIEFKLATLDENGNCTTGITRHYDSAADWELSSSNYKYTWNRTRYLNIYVVKTLPPGIAAYTYLPGTSSAIMDAIVVMHPYVGSIGTGSQFGSRVITHEVGHWFNLQHTWGSNNQPGVVCGDDGVGDTPLTKGFSFCNLANADVCTSGVDENVQNYMEYAFCQNMFTQGQRNRMHNCLNSANAGRSNLWSPANILTTGVYNPPVACPPKADFNCNVTVACLGDTVSFNDYSYNGVINTWEWSSANAVNVSNLQNGKLVFNQTGPAVVKLKISNANGTDSLLKTSVIILPGAYSGNNNLVQSFENFMFPDSLWQRTQPEFGSAFNTTGLSAKTGSQSVWVNNFYDNPNEAVALYTPRFLFQGMFPSQLSFYYAYAQKSSGSNDKLSVYASTNCGLNWNKILELTGASLSTVTGFSNTPFFPNSQQFGLGTISLAPYSNEQLYLKFEFLPDENGAGNNFFIDNIMVSGVTAVELESVDIGLSVYPNPTQREICVQKTESFSILRVQMMDLTAHCVFETQVGEPINCFSIPNELNDGLYFLKIESNSGSQTFKIIIQK
jgi:PKD repeat protein